MKPFGTIKLNVFVPAGRDDDASIFADADKLQALADDIEALAQSLLPPGWSLKLE